MQVTSYSKRRRWEVYGLCSGSVPEPPSHKYMVLHINDSYSHYVSRIFTPANGTCIDTIVSLVSIYLS